MSVCANAVNANARGVCSLRSPFGAPVDTHLSHECAENPALSRWNFGAFLSLTKISNCKNTINK